MQCPVCKADNAQGPLCRRCKADLSLLFRLEARRADVVLQRALLPAQLESDALDAVAAECGGDLADGLRPAVGGEHADHAAGGVAVERRERTAQHLDPRRRRQVEVRDLALPVRSGGGNAVHIQAQAAHAEGGPGAEAARGDLDVLRVVLPVERHHPRHPRQRFRQVDLRSAVADGLRVDHVDRSRRVEGALLDAAGDADHHRAEEALAHRDGGLCCRRQRRQHRQAQNSRQARRPIKHVETLHECILWKGLMDVRGGQPARDRNWASVSPIQDSSNFATARWLPSRAMSAAVLPRASLSARLAPCSSSSRTVPSCP